MKQEQGMDFEKGAGLVPAIVQDARTGVVLMLGYMNAEAIKKSRATGYVTFYSRSKKRLWTKGETSGNYLTLEAIIPDCDSDTLLVKAIPQGPACHTGNDTCFGETNAALADFLPYLEGIVAERHSNPTQESYTSSLFAEGLEAIAQKVGEEATEVVIAGLKQGEERVASEVADLLFHVMVLLRARNIPWRVVIDVLRSRHSARRAE